MKISVVVPVYGCKKALPELYRRLTEELEKICGEHEIILIDDFCPQKSWDEIVKLCEKDDRVIGIKMARNFGQPSAITAGLDVCSGDWIVVMDCDLQDPPEEIHRLLNKALEGYDVVFARRVERKDSKVTMWLSKKFHDVYDYFVDAKTDNTVANFSIVSKKVIDYYRKMREHNRAYQNFIVWMGFPSATIDIIGEERFAGKSSYSFKKKMKFALSSIISQSNKPLYLTVRMGFCIAVLSFMYILYLCITKILGSDVPLGWTSTIASIYLMGGLLLFGIGVVGVYVGNVFNETKNRPIYLVQETRNLHFTEIKEHD